MLSLFDGIFVACIAICSNMHIHILYIYIYNCKKETCLVLKLLITAQHLRLLFFIINLTCSLNLL